MKRSLVIALLVSGTLLFGTGVGFAQDGGTGSGGDSTGPGVDSTGSESTAASEGGGITGLEVESTGPRSPAAGRTDSGADSRSSERLTHGPLSLTPADALELALRESSAVRNARINFGIAERSDQASWNRFLPSITASGGPSYSFSEDVEDRLGLSSQLSARLTLSGATIDGGERREQALRSSALALDEAEWDLRREVLRAYFSLVSLKASVELQEQRVAAARSRLEQTRTRFESGAVSEFDLLEAQLSYQNTLPELTSVEQRLSRASRDFKVLIGVPEEQQLELVREIPYLDLDATAAELLASHGSQAPSVRSAQAGQTTARLEARSDRRGLLPSLSASASVGYGADEPFEEWRRTGSASLSLSLPIDPFVPGSEEGVAREASDDRLTVADNRLAAARRELERALRNAVEEAEATAEQIEMVQENAALADRVFEIARRRFEAGAIEALELQNTEVERTRARVAVIEERLAHVQALIEVEYLLGVNLPDLPW